MTHTPAARPSIRRVLITLFVIQFFAWSGMFALWVDAYPVVTRYIMRGDPANAASMQKGLIAISLCYAFYATAAACLAFVLPRLTARWGEGWVLGAALLFSGAGLASLGVIDRPLWLAPAFAGIAVGWAALGNLPYWIVSAAAPEARITHYMQVFSFSSVIPQVAVTLGLALFGSIIFGSASQLIMIAGGASMGVAAVLCVVFRRTISTPPAEPQDED